MVNQSKSQREHGRQEELRKLLEKMGDREAEKNAGN